MKLNTKTEIIEVLAVSIHCGNNVAVKNNSFGIDFATLRQRQPATRQKQFTKIVKRKPSKPLIISHLQGILALEVRFIEKITGLILCLHKRPV